MKYYFILLLFIYGGCDLSSLESKRVQYSVSGSASTVFITYENSSGNAEQMSSVTLPWTYSFSAESGTFVYVSAQNNDDSGSVTAQIKVDGKVIETATSNGAYVIATASGSVP